MKFTIAITLFALPAAIMATCSPVGNSKLSHPHSLTNTLPHPHTLSQHILMPKSATDTEPGGLAPCLDWCYSTNARQFGGEDKIPASIITGCSLSNCDTCAP